MTPSPARRRLIRLLAGAPLLMAGCAGLRRSDPVQVRVAGLEPLPGEGLEMRFLLKLRVQNPNDFALDYDGLALQIDLKDRDFASGVSDVRGSVPPFGEAVIGLPISVSPLSAVRQLLELDGADLDRLPYSLRGKLGGGPLGTQRFSAHGTLALPVTRAGW